MTRVHAIRLDLDALTEVTWGLVAMRLPFSMISSLMIWIWSLSEVLWSYFAWWFDTVRGLDVMIWPEDVLLSLLLLLRSTYTCTPPGQTLPNFR